MGDPPLGRDTRHAIMGPSQPDEPEVEEPTGPNVPSWMSAAFGVRDWVVFDEGIEPYSESGFIAQSTFTLDVVPAHCGDFATGFSTEDDRGQTAPRFATSSRASPRSGSVRGFRPRIGSAD